MELNPCPFCGEEAILREVEPHTHVLAKWMPDYSGGAFIECTGCTVAMSGGNASEAVEAWNKRTYTVPMMQYDNLRKHFRQLVNDVLGENYYNEGMDVYTCDEYCCQDLKARMKRKWF